jgi:transcriptional regulator with XRE-family HTH domain
MKPARLVAENVEALLKQRGFKQTDLAKWCHHSDTWVSQFLKGLRKWRIDDLERVADLLGVPPYQLLLPGVSASTERRKGDRRRGQERRRPPAARAPRASTDAPRPRKPRRS